MDFTNFIFHLIAQTLMTKNGKIRSKPETIYDAVAFIDISQASEIKQWMDMGLVPLPGPSNDSLITFYPSS